MVPESQKWMDYWNERADQILAGDHEVKNCLIPLEVVDAVLKDDDSARSDDYR